MKQSQPDDPLARDFATPPDTAKPRVWWHWMNGNITKEGIEKDLQWMKQIGIGGLQNFDGGLDIPQVVERRLEYMTPEWKEALKYAVRRAEELGLEFAIASSPGWSETGGPWVAPKDGMKKLVWSETGVNGGVPFRGQLAPPPSVSGPFQYLAVRDADHCNPVQGAHFYRDIAVLAYRTPLAFKTNPVPISITTNAPNSDTSGLLRVDTVQPLVLPASEDRPGWILYDFGTPQRLRAASLARAEGSWLTGFTWAIQTSNDGTQFDLIAEFPDERLLRHTTVDFSPVLARFARLTMSPVPRNKWVHIAANAPGADYPSCYKEPARDVTIYGLRFYTGARVHRFEEKAGFAVAPNYYALESGSNAADDAIDPDGTLDLTDKLSADGQLQWSPPAGDWTVLRLGYSLTGKTNHPASPEATGLEVDKLDSQAVESYLETYLGNFEEAVGSEWMGKRGIRALLTDSIEAHGQNWTPRLIEEFRARRGYSPMSWLPALTGVIVGDTSRTDRFLWDFRQTLIDLIAEAHYGQIAESVHARGMIYYSESLEGHPTFAMGDDLDMRAPADIPMAAIWTNYSSHECDGIPSDVVDMLGAASVAHVYGKPLVAVEALTSAFEPWAFHPGNLRPFIDLAFALGVNRPVIHASVHQPTDKKPGVTLGPYGQHFTRHETWAEMATPWLMYLSRCSYLLQQGQHVADVAWFYGEEGSLAGLWAQAVPADLPKGFGFDFISAAMLLHQTNIEGGHLVSSGGARYRLLYLGGTSERMTLRTLRRLKLLSDGGILIAGRRPSSSPSLSDAGPAAQSEFLSLVVELWDSGKIWDAPMPDAALQRLGVPPDFAYSAPNTNASVLFTHRALDRADIYFVANRRARKEQIEARFRVKGPKPMLWHADTGARETVAWWVDGGQTHVPLTLEAHQSVFVVFRDVTEDGAKECSPRQESLLERLTGEWELSFASDCGAPDGVRSWSLTSLTNSTESGIRYFSGIATYRKQFTLKPWDVRSGDRVLLDLGDVRELAEVDLNDKPVGTVWHAPFRLDVTDVVVAGFNTLEVRVANLWVNRLIGDQQPGAQPVASTVTRTYEAGAPLRPSGLLGPVTLLISTDARQE